MLGESGFEWAGLLDNEACCKDGFAYGLGVGAAVLHEGFQVYQMCSSQMETLEAATLLNKLS